MTTPAEKHFKEVREEARVTSFRLEVNPGGTPYVFCHGLPAVINRLRTDPYLIEKLIHGFRITISLENEEDES